MEEEGAKKTELQPESVTVESTSAPPPQEKEHSPVKEKESKNADPPNGVAKEDTSIPVPKEPVVQKVADAATKENSGDSVDKDSALARVETEKRLALIKAWEESEKTKSENKASRRLSAVGLWEDSKKASVEAELKKIEEKLEKKKAEYVEKMKNKMAEIHQSAEEKRAMVEAQRSEEFLKVEETAAKFRKSGYTPRKLLACFSG